MTGTETTQARPPGFASFTAVWIAQLVSMCGSGLSTFALEVWVFQETRSVTQFALIAVSASLPTVLLLPFVGAYVDRWDLRRTLVAADAIGAITTAVLLVLIAAGQIAVWPIYVAAAITALASAVHWSAFSAVTTLLVPGRHLGRAAGMVEFSGATTNVVAPMLAGVLMVTVGVVGVLFLDIATCVVAIATLLLARIPPRPAHPDSVASRGGSIFGEVGFGWRYITSRPSLVRLLAFFSTANLFASFSMVLVLPLVLGFASAQTLGLVLSVGSVGLIAGGALMGVWGGPRRRILGIVGPGLLLGLSIAVVGLRPFVPLVAAGFFLFNLAIPVMQGSSQAIWQSKVPVALQGRVFAIRRMIATFTRPVAFLLAGPAADRVFEPALTPGGTLATTAGRVVGTGPGRGIGALLIMLGLALIGTAVWGLTSSRLMRVERDLPDVNETVVRKAAAP